MLINLSKMVYVRKQFNTLKERILEPRKFMQVLAGPRQVGKSTLVGQVLSQIDIAHVLEVADAVDQKESGGFPELRGGSPLLMTAGRLSTNAIRYRDVCRIACRHEGEEAFGRRDDYSELRTPTLVFSHLNLS